METLAIFSPAKINLFLAVTGQRADGFHDLVSVVAPLDFGDTLEVEPAPATSLGCDDPEVPLDESNLVWRAVRAFAQATGNEAGLRFMLRKRIPMGAGLGGGSSNAVAALRALNARVGAAHALSDEMLATLAAGLGSDCPLFLAGGPVTMRGRGERLSLLPQEAARRLRGRRVLLFKPGFGVATPWAYARLAAGGGAGYLPAAEAEARLATWLGDPAAPAEGLLFNSLEQPVFGKYLALPALRELLRREFGLHLAMSGSGSACFVLLGATAAAGPVETAVRKAWGASTFVREARIA